MAAAKHPPAKGSSFRQKFWSRGSANHFGNGDDDNDASNPPVVRPTQPYVPKHAGSDFSRMKAQPAYHGLDPQEQRIARQRANRSPPPPEEDEVPPNPGAGITVMRDRAVPAPAPIASRRHQLHEEPRRQAPVQAQPRTAAAPATTMTMMTTTSKTPAFTSHNHNYSVSSNPFADRDDASSHEETLTDDAQERQALVTPQPIWPSQPPRPVRGTTSPPATSTTPSPPPPSSSTKAPSAPRPTDFELFMARALEEEKATSSAAWRAIRGGSATGSGPPLPPWGGTGTERPFGQMYLPSNATATATANTVVRTNTARTSKRDSAYYSTGGGGGGGAPRPSLDPPTETTATATEEKPPRRSGAGSAPSPTGFRARDHDQLPRTGSASPPPSSQHGSGSGSAHLRRRPSLSKKVAEYIKPVRPAHERPIAE